MEEIIQLISKYGFPIIAAFGIGGMVFYVWKWVSTEIKPVISETHKTLIKLVDKIRMLDNDLIRLHQKVNVTLTLKQRKNNKIQKSKKNNH